MIDAGRLLADLAERRPFADLKSAACMGPLEGLPRATGTR
jgi:hypothetical protein